MNFRWWRKWEERKRLAQEDAMILIARYGTRASHRPEPSRLRLRARRPDVGQPPYLFLLEARGG